MANPSTEGRYSPAAAPPEPVESQLPEDQIQSWLARVRVGAAACTKARRLDTLSSMDGSPDRVPELPDAKATASEERQLRNQLAAANSEQDRLIHLVLEGNAGLVQSLARRWSRLTSRHRGISAPVGRLSKRVWLTLTLRGVGSIRVNPLFDAKWYQATYPDAPQGRRAAYRQCRALERDPNAYFDTRWYLSRNPDVAKGRWNPLDHYLYVGWREGRNPGPAFDGFEYLRHHPDAVAQAVNPLLHMLTAAQAVGTPATGTPATRSHLPGLPPAAKRAVTHFRRHGARQTLRRAAGELRTQASISEGRRPVVPEAHAGRINASLDEPRMGAVEGSSAIIVAGWAFASGSEVSVEAFIDRAPAASCVVDQSRPDVASIYPQHPEAASSGFSARLPLGDIGTGSHLIEIVIRDGAGACRVLARPFRRVSAGEDYHHYYQRALPTRDEITTLRTDARVGATPVHLVVIASLSDGLQRTLTSIAAQAYPSLTCTVLCDPAVVDDSRAVVDAVLPAAAITVATSADPALPEEPDPERFVGVLRAGEVLAPGALVRFIAGHSLTAPDLIYSDHDTVNETGRHTRPWFVPDWAPDHLLSQDYVGGVYLVRDGNRFRELLRRASDVTERSWRYRLLLGTTEGATRIAHVPAILWSEPEAHADPERAASEQAVTEETLKARGTDASVETVVGDPQAPVRSVGWPLVREPLVSVIVPTTGRLEFVREVVESLTSRTAYQNVELLFIDNSRGKHPEGIAYLQAQGLTVLERDEPFNWAKLNNDGARLAQGELLLFLNDDVEVTDPEWLGVLVRHALRDGVGAVGPLMTYPDGKIQHIGVFLVGHGGGAVHLFHGMTPGDGLYLGLDRVTREVSSLTGACLLVPSSTVSAGSTRSSPSSATTSTSACVSLALDVGCWWSRGATSSIARASPAPVSTSRSMRVACGSAGLTCSAMVTRTTTPTSASRRSMPRWPGSASPVATRPCCVSRARRA